VSVSGFNSLIVGESAQLIMGFEEGEHDAVGVEGTEADLDFLASACIFYPGN